MCTSSLISHRAEYLAHKEQYDSNKPPKKTNERDMKEIVEGTNPPQTVAEAIKAAKADGADDEIVDPIVIPKDKDGKPNYGAKGLTVDKLKKHAAQRNPPVDIPAKMRKSDIIKKLQEADTTGEEDDVKSDQNGDSENEDPPVAGPSKPVSLKRPNPTNATSSTRPNKKLKLSETQILSVDVLNTIFGIGPDGNASDYDVVFESLAAAQSKAEAKKQKKDIEHYKLIIASLEAAQKKSQPTEPEGASSSPTDASKKKPSTIAKWFADNRLGSVSSSDSSSETQGVIEQFDKSEMDDIDEMRGKAQTAGDKWGAYMLGFIKRRAVEERARLGFSDRYPFNSSAPKGSKQWKKDMISWIDGNYGGEESSYQSEREVWKGQLERKKQLEAELAEETEEQQEDEDEFHGTKSPSAGKRKRTPSASETDPFKKQKTGSSSRQGSSSKPKSPIAKSPGGSRRPSNNPKSPDGSRHPSSNRMSPSGSRRPSTRRPSTRRQTAHDDDTIIDEEPSKTNEGDTEEEDIEEQYAQKPKVGEEEEDAGDELDEIIDREMGEEVNSEDKQPAVTPWESEESEEE